MYWTVELDLRFCPRGIDEMKLWMDVDGRRRRSWEKIKQSKIPSEYAAGTKPPKQSKNQSGSLDDRCRLKRGFQTDWKKEVKDQADRKKEILKLLQKIVETDEEKQICLNGRHPVETILKQLL